MIWRLVGTILVKPEEWQYSGLISNNVKTLRLRSFLLPQSGRGTFCLYLPDGSNSFQRVYPSNQPTLIAVPPAITTQWRRAGIRGTANLQGIWIINVEAIDSGYVWQP